MPKTLTFTRHHCTPLNYLNLQCSPTSEFVALPYHAFIVVQTLQWPCQGWEAAVCPLGGLQSAAHRRCAKRARPQQQSPVRYVKINQQMANLKGQAPYAGLGSCSPIFFFPQEPGDHRNPEPKCGPTPLVGPLGSIFCSSRACFKNDF